SGDTVTAYGIANLKGGSGNNDFVFQNGASISGMITGGSGGINELDYSAYTSAITVDLATGTATGTGGISNIHSVVDGSGNDTLTGGSGNDTFILSNCWGSDTITGGGGSDTLDFSSVTSNLTFTANANGTTSVTDGTDTVTASGIVNLKGGKGSNSFVYEKGASISGTITGGGNGTLDLSAVASNLTFTIDTNGTISVTDGTDTVTATGIANLKGGSDNNYFVFQNGALIKGTITGGSGGINELNYSAYVASVNVNLKSGTATGTAGVSNIQSVIGGSGSDTLAGGNGSDIFAFSNGWGSDTITGGGSDTLDFSGVTANLTFYITTGGTIYVIDGSGDTVTASGVANLKGGSGNNDFVFQNGASITGTITGGSGGVNQLDYSSYTTHVSVNLLAGTATGTAGISNIQSVKGGSGNSSSYSYNFSNGWGSDTITGGGSDMLDFSSVTASLTFTVNANDTITVTDGTGDTVTASGIANLKGGSGNNTFVYDNGAHFS